MKICYTNEQVEQTMIELNIELVQLGYVDVDDMECNLDIELRAIRKFLDKITYKAIRIYMPSEDVKNERLEDEIGYVITAEGKRKDIYFEGDSNVVVYYLED